MERKNFQIVMRPEAHKRAKVRAGQLGITIGQYLENLISGMELRLERAYSHGKGKNMAGLIDASLLKDLFEADKKGWNQEKLDQKLFSTVLEAEKQNMAFTPAINVGPNK